MDIGQWLEDIDPTKQPGTTNQLGALDSTTVRRRMQKPHESSPLKPAVTYTSAARSEQCTISSKDSDLESESASTTALRSVTSSSSDQYRRKARHRTRVDKYTPKTKVDHGNKKRTQKAKKKDPKRRRRKKDSNEHVTGVVPSFQAKNIPSKNRLTLNPSKAGLYTKGRASDPTRGKGLPDLVFSEMRFLQKRGPDAEKEHRRSSKNNRKKGAQEQSEEEISAYFEADKRRKSQADRNQERRKKELHEATERPDIVPPTPLVAGLPDKPFLGFGSRGTTVPTASYCTWSESDRPLSTPLVPFRSCLETMNVGQLDNFEVTGPPPSLRMPNQGPTEGRLCATTQLLPPSPRTRRMHESRGAVQADPGIQVEQKELGSSRNPDRGRSRNMADETSIDAGNDANPHHEHKTAHDMKNREAGIPVIDDSQLDISNGPIPKRCQSPMGRLLDECGQAARTLMPMYREPPSKLPPCFIGHEDNNLHLWRTEEEQGCDWYDQNTEAHLDTTPYPARLEPENWIEQSVPWDVLTEDFEGYSQEPQLYEYLDEQYNHNGVLVHDQMQDQELMTDMRFERVSVVEDGAGNDDGYQSEGLTGFWRPNRLY